MFKRYEPYFCGGFGCFWSFSYHVVIWALLTVSNLFFKTMFLTDNFWSCLTSVLIHCSTIKRGGLKDLRDCFVERLENPKQWQVEQRVWVLGPNSSWHDRHFLRKVVFFQELPKPLFSSFLSSVFAQWGFQTSRANSWKKVSVLIKNTT